MKMAKIESDYSTSKLSLIQTDDGDIVVGLYDDRYSFLQHL
jgi:hypothetical protein